VSSFFYSRGACCVVRRALTRRRLWEFFRFRRISPRTTKRSPSGECFCRLALIGACVGTNCLRVGWRSRRGFSLALSFLPAFGGCLLLFLLEISSLRVSWEPLDGGVWVFGSEVAG
jgi:hypothetical protein